MLSPGVVEPVLGKLHTEAVVGTAVQAGDEALDRLFGEEFKRSDLPELVGMQVDGHVLSKIRIRKRPAVWRGVSNRRIFRGA